MAYTNQTLITALKTARNKAGLSQRALSAKASIPQSHISKIESGKSDITLSTLVELARALEVEIMLVPRNMVPAVKSITRDKTEEKAAAPRPAYQLDDDEDDDNA